jgi:hypothetical protein
MTAVSGEVAEEELAQTGIKQIPATQITLRKKLFFR